MDLVILNHGQMTRTLSEPSYPLPTSVPHQRKDVLPNELHMHRVSNWSPPLRIPDLITRLPWARLAGKKTTANSVANLKNHNCPVRLVSLINLLNNL
ncbi:hypothetical protein AVEN_50668-1 [Araneus ventricosus]|uniref:Uncharacterized protein n=1 Tax=Araneus ventricosus TaxID=182803 RepID=A0A4Y2JLM7_ARAVE|nr:hypothetical protein AVEN_50668-1 [Araneus ventricosus]